MEDSSTPFDKLPPHSIISEQCLIASMMLDAAVAADAITKLKPEAFYLADHAIYFGIIRDFHREGRPIDAVILREELDKRGQLEPTGGTAYLAEMLNTVPSSANGPWYANIVAEKYRVRSIIAACNDALRTAYSPSDDASPSIDIVGQLQTKLTDVVTGAGAESVSFSDAIDETLAELESGGKQCLPTGFRDIDEWFAGLGYGEAIVVAARPSMGKSILAKQIVVHAAMEGFPMGLIAAEESRKKVIRNALSWFTGIENGRLGKGRDRGRFTNEEWERVKRMAERLRYLPIHIADQVWDLDQISALATTWKIKYGIRGLVVDHLGLVQCPAARTPYERASKVSTALKQLYKRLDVAGVSVVQVTRGNTTRDDKRPTMADLRDSGRIEEDADGIILLHREDYYHLTDPQYTPTNQAELIFAKWKDGDTSRIVTLESYMGTMHFEDRAEELPPL